jgi:hypothetical protein
VSALIYPQKSQSGRREIREKKTKTKTKKEEIPGTTQILKQNAQLRHGRV